MDDTPQAHLVVLVAGAVLSAAVLSVAAGQAAEGERAGARHAADALAAAIAFSGCSSATPSVTVDLSPAHGAWAGPVRSAQLLGDRVHIVFDDGASYTSVVFRPLRTAGPVDLLAPPALLLDFDPLSGVCGPLPAPPENA